MNKIFETIYIYTVCYAAEMKAQHFIRIVFQIKLQQTLEEEPQLDCCKGRGR